MSSISSIKTPLPTPAQSKAPEAAEATRAVKGARSDGDSDDSGAKAQAASAPSPAPAPKPVTNTMGQLIGKTIDVQA